MKGVIPYWCWPQSKDGHNCCFGEKSEDQQDSTLWMVACKRNVTFFFRTENISRWIMVNWICSEIYQNDDLWFVVWGEFFPCFSHQEKKAHSEKRPRSSQPSKITHELHASVFGSCRFSGGFHGGFSAWNSSTIEVCGEQFFVGSRVSSFSLHVKSKSSQHLEKCICIPRSW